MRLLSVLALLAASLTAGAAPEKDKPKPLTGTYVKKVEGTDFKIVFKKDNVMEFHVTAGEVGCLMTAKYTRAKDGTINAEITEFEKKGDFPVAKEKGYKFSFKWEPGDKKGKLTELRGEEINPDQQAAVEGEYEAQAD